MGEDVLMSWGGIGLSPELGEMVSQSGMKGIITVPYDASMGMRFSD